MTDRIGKAYALGQANGESEGLLQAALIVQEVFDELSTASRPMPTGGELALEVIKRINDRAQATLALLKTRRAS